MRTVVVSPSLHPPSFTHVLMCEVFVIWNSVVWDVNNFLCVSIYCFNLLVFSASTGGIAGILVLAIYSAPVPSPIYDTMYMQQCTCMYNIYEYYFSELG